MTETGILCGGERTTQAAGSRDNLDDGNDPTAPAPEEIRAACLSYQETWSPEVERKRAAWAHRRVEVLATRVLIDEARPD